MEIAFEEEAETKHCLRSQPDLENEQLQADGVKEAEGQEPQPEERSPGEQSKEEKDEDTGGILQQEEQEQADGQEDQSPPEKGEVVSEGKGEAQNSTPQEEPASNPDPAQSEPPAAGPPGSAPPVQQAQPTQSVPPNTTVHPPAAEHQAPLAPPNPPPAAPPEQAKPKTSSYLENFKKAMQNVKKNGPQQLPQQKQQQQQPQGQGLPPIVQEKHHRVTVCDTDLLFPYEPYPMQIQYMERIVQACQQGKNALMESPTGTGKTLCLLVSCLGWLKKSKRMSVRESIEPKVIYCSRTHSQLTQVIREIRKTSYAPKISIIGSRDQFCVNGQINGARGTALNSLCKKSREMGKNDPQCCSFFKNLGDQVAPFEWSLHDIEDLYQLGLRNQVCPYYLQKNRVTKAELILMPYNYLVDPKIRENYKIDFENSIIILDEAHNIERVSEEVASFELQMHMFPPILGELSNLATQIEASSGETGNSRRFQSNLHNIMEIIVMTENFMNYFREFDPYSMNSGRVDIREVNDPVFEGDQIFELYFTGTNYTGYNEYNGPPNFEGLKPTNFGHWIHVFEKCVADLTELAQNQRPAIERWWDSIKKVIRLHRSTGYLAQRKNIRGALMEGKEEILENEVFHYYMLIKQNDHRVPQHLNKFERERRLKQFRSLSFWCFNPGLGFRKLLNLSPRTLILTSGTLSPLAAFQQEMMMDFPIQFEAHHVIQPNQAKISILKEGVNGVPFNFSHKFREEQQMMADLGETLVRVMEVTPGGMLVFFSSYTTLYKYFDYWDDRGIAHRMAQLKGVYKEPRDYSQYKYVISSYYQDVTQHRGAILFAVCRGKISEGLDFSDDAARCVVLVGIPYPQMMDEKTVLKRHYLDRKVHHIQKLSGKQWYCQQATRTLNQAIGRVIRHKEDYGNIILMDERFDSNDQLDDISNWIRDRVEIYENTQQAIGQFKDFFDQMDKLNLNKKSQRLAQFRLEFGENDLEEGIQDAVKEFKLKAIADQPKGGDDDDVAEIKGGRNISYCQEKKRKKMQRYLRKKVKIGELLRDFMNRPGRALEYQDINDLKTFLGIKRFLYVLRFFHRVAGKKPTDSSNVKKDVLMKGTIKFDPFEQFEINPTVACKRILEVIFQRDQMNDYMNYSSASEDDSTYEECERDEEEDNDVTETSGSSPDKSGSSASPAKSDGVSRKEALRAVEIDITGVEGSDGSILRVNQEQLEVAKKLIDFMLDRCSTCAIQLQFQQMVNSFLAKIDALLHRKQRLIELSEVQQLSELPEKPTTTDSSPQESPQKDSTIKSSSASKFSPQREDEDSFDPSNAQIIEDSGTFLQQDAPGDDEDSPVATSEKEASAAESEDEEEEIESSDSPSKLAGKRSPLQPTDQLEEAIFEDPNNFLLEQQEQEHKRIAHKNTKDLINLLGGKKNEETGDTFNGLLNAPQINGGMSRLKNEIRVKDGRVKNPKKRKLYQQNPQAQVRQCVSFAQMSLSSQNQAKYRPIDAKAEMFDPKEKQSGFSSFLNIIDNDLMNPTGVKSVSGFTLGKPTKQAQEEAFPQLIGVSQEKPVEIEPEKPRIRNGVYQGGGGPSAWEQASQFEGAYPDRRESRPQFPNRYERGGFSSFGNQDYDSRSYNQGGRGGNGGGYGSGYGGGGSGGGGGGYGRSNYGGGYQNDQGYGVRSDFNNFGEASSYGGNSYGRGGGFGGRGGRGRGGRGGRGRGRDHDYDPRSKPQFAISSLAHSNKNIVQNSFSRLKHKKEEERILMGREVYHGGKEQANIDFDEMQGFQNIFK